MAAAAARGSRARSDGATGAWGGVPREVGIHGEAGGASVTSGVVGKGSGAGEWRARAEAQSSLLGVAPATVMLRGPGSMPAALACRGARGHLPAPSRSKSGFAAVVLLSPAAAADPSWCPPQSPPQEAAPAVAPPRGHRFPPLYLRVRVCELRGAPRAVDRPPGHAPAGGSGAVGVPPAEFLAATET